MNPARAIAALTIVAVLLIMAGEAALSAFNERLLRSRGAVEPAGDVYALMRWAYPLGFALMGLEGLVWGPSPPIVLAAGLSMFGVAKALKLWAISSLGTRWTFRVLVLPGEPLVVRGPYRWVRHPNYLAVIGELISVALIVWAPVTGAVSTIGFGALIARRVRVEDRALGRQ
jgi:methyltransferase